MLLSIYRWAADLLEDLLDGETDWSLSNGVLLYSGYTKFYVSFNFLKSSFTLQIFQSGTKQYFLRILKTKEFKQLVWI